MNTGGETSDSEIAACMTALAASRELSESTKPERIFRHGNDPF
jgi:hypothetical protein